MKIVEKYQRKVFTKNNRKDIIYNKYNLLNKNNSFYEREGLSMKKTEDIVLKEITKELNFVERIIVNFFSRTFIKVYKKGINFWFNKK